MASATEKKDFFLPAPLGGMSKKITIEYETLDVGKNNPIKGYPELNLSLVKKGKAAYVVPWDSAINYLAAVSGKDRKQIPHDICNRYAFYKFFAAYEDPKMCIGMFNELKDIPKNVISRAEFIIFYAISHISVGEAANQGVEVGTEVRDVIYKRHGSERLTSEAYQALQKNIKEFLS